MPSSITSSNRSQNKFEQIRYHTNVEVRKRQTLRVLRIEAGTPPNAKDTNIHIKDIGQSGILSFGGTWSLRLEVCDISGYMKATPANLQSMIEASTAKASADIDHCQCEVKFLHTGSNVNGSHMTSLVALNLAKAFNNCFKFRLAHTLLMPYVLYGLEVVAGTTAANFLKFSRVVNSMS
uniref:Uncharacterized protein n=1 Tax=Glossina pallidipes TaxID=7398 RepID=A0A1A9ZH79_GLOPL